MEESSSFWDLNFPCVPIIATWKEPPGSSRCGLGSDERAGAQCLFRRPTGLQDSASYTAGTADNPLGPGVAEMTSRVGTGVDTRRRRLNSVCWLRLRPVNVNTARPTGTRTGNSQQQPLAQFPNAVSLLPKHARPSNYSNVIEVGNLSSTSVITAD